MGSNDDYLFSSVKSIQATGTYTVTVTLAHPDASWRYSPAYADIFEKKFAQDHSGTFGKPGVLVMGSGPWEVDSLDPTSGAELSANPHWWGGTVPIQHISVKIFSSPTSEALAFRAGDVDLDTYILGPRASRPLRAPRSFPLRVATTRCSTSTLAAWAGTTSMSGGPLPMPSTGRTSLQPMAVTPARTTR